MRSPKPADITITPYITLRPFLLDHTACLNGFSMQEWDTCERAKMNSQCRQRIRARGVSSPRTSGVKSVLLAMLRTAQCQSYRE